MLYDMKHGFCLSYATLYVFTTLHSVKSKYMYMWNCCLQNIPGPFQGNVKYVTSLGRLQVRIFYMLLLQVSQCIEA